MFSIIIPTMWRSDLILELLSKLQASFLVDEIILIDNDPINKLDISQFTKIKYLTKGYNIYVNPAWNWGVAESKNELIAICNDDIVFDVNSVLSLVLENQHGLGCIGMHGLNYIEGCDTSSFTKIINQSQINQYIKGNGWGCLIFLKKSNWIEIPNNLKIWYGDDWIFTTNRPTYVLRLKDKIKNKGKSITVTSNPIFNQITKNDGILWNRIFKPFN